jgi:hypothetical protein
MDFINENIIQLLIKERDELCISAYIPAHRAWNETNQDLLRFKNLMKKLDKELTERNISPQQREKLLKPARALQNDLEFWRYQQDGLAIFINSSEFYYIKLPISFEENIFIGEQFHIIPLIPAITETFDFYVLLLDQRNMKLYRSHHYSLQPVTVPDMPKDLDQALAYDYPGRNLQHKTIYQSIATGSGANFHGHGDNESKAKDNILEYFRIVNNAVNSVIGDDIIPLVLTGVEYLHSIYREANTYPHLYEKGITKKSPDMREDDIYYESKKILEPHFKKVQEDALALYGNLAPTERASDNIKEIIKAAFSKRISHLFINPAEKKWGYFDFKNFDVILNQERTNGDIELLGLAVSETIRNNGLVYLLDTKKMPNGKPAAAIFRY